uniref:Uncharacterized protein n=1 Tax=Leersia perrieri TaxID=77586 RepID=A0A0D9XQ58_9ORYZ
MWSTPVSKAASLPSSPVDISSNRWRASALCETERNSSDDGITGGGREHHRQGIKHNPYSTSPRRRQLLRRCSSERQCGNAANAGAMLACLMRSNRRDERTRGDEMESQAPDHHGRIGSGGAATGEAEEGS